MTRLLASAVLAALLAAPASVPASARSPATVRDSITRDGAGATIADLATAGQCQGTRHLPGVLPSENPPVALAALDPANRHIIGADRVCGLPFVEDTVPDLPACRSKAIHAVRAVKDTKLASARTACPVALAAAG